jgi:hypothetical protein
VCDASQCVDATMPNVPRSSGLVVKVTTGIYADTSDPTGLTPRLGLADATGVRPVGSDPDD